MPIIKNVNSLPVCLLILFAFAGSLFFAAELQAQTASPEAVIKAFYNGYINEMNKKREPLDKSSPIKKYLSAQLTPTKIKSFENKTEADYFFQSQEFFDDWENKFTVSKPAVKGATASAIVTFPGEYPRVKVTLVKEKGEWKISNVQNAQK